MRVSSFSPCVFHSPNKNDVFVFYSRRKHLPLEDQLLSFIWRSRVKFTDKMINLLLNQHYPIPHTHTPSHLKTTISYNNWPMLAVQLHLNCIAIHWNRLQVGLIEISEGIRHISEDWKLQQQRSSLPQYGSLLTPLRCSECVSLSRNHYNTVWGTR